MMQISILEWTGDVVDLNMRFRLETSRDVMWKQDGVWFCGLDREWLRGLRIAA